MKVAYSIDDEVIVNGKYLGVVKDHRPISNTDNTLVYDIELYSKRAPWKPTGTTLTVTIESLQPFSINDCFNLKEVQQLPKLSGGCYLIGLDCDRANNVMGFKVAYKDYKRDYDNEVVKLISDITHRTPRFGDEYEIYVKYKGNNNDGDAGAW